MTYIDKAFDILTACARPMTWNELANDIPGSVGETISRALRKLTDQGYVIREPKDPNKPRGTKLWSINPAAPPRKSRAQTKLPLSPPMSSKGSSGKAFAMCLPVNKPTLVTATIQAIDELVSAKSTFSAHDVTKKLRDMVKDGKATVDHTETGTVYAYGKTLPRIEHEDVKGIVHEYFSTGKMGSYTRFMDGDHWAYSEPKAAQVTANPPPIVLLMPAADYDGDPVL